MESSIPRALRLDSHLERFVLTDVALTGTTLGRGSYGSVLEVRWQERLCAAKKLHEVLLESDNEGVEELVMKFKRECQLMASLHHPNVTQFLGVWFPAAAQWPLLVMEKLVMSLDDALVSVPDIAFFLKLSILCDVVRGLHYLHSHTPPIVHRDLTAKNVLLTSTLTGKITDLGNSRRLGVVSGDVVSGAHHAAMTRAPGTLVYMAPEAVSEASVYGPPLDVFSVGQLALYTLIQVFPSNLLPGTYPDPSNPDSTMARSEVQRREVYFEKAESEFGRLHPSLLDLVKQCLHNAPGRRPSCEQALGKLENIKDKVESESGGVSWRHLEVTKVMLAKELRDKTRRVQELEDLVGSLQLESKQLKEKVVTMETETQETDRHLWSLRWHSQERERELQERISVLHEDQLRMETMFREQLEQKEKLVQNLRKQLHTTSRTTITRQCANSDDRHILGTTEQPDSTSISNRDMDPVLNTTSITSRDIDPVLNTTSIGSRDMELTEVSCSSSTTREPESATPGMGVALEKGVVWERGSDMPVGMSGYMQSVVVGGVVYVGGGHTNYVDNESIVMAYNSSTGKWSKLPRYFARRFAMAALDNQLVLVGGCSHGYEDTNVLGVWHRVRREWSHPYPAMPTKRSDSSAVGWKHWLLVAGGISGGHGVATVEVLDSSHGGQWSTAPSTPTPWTSMRSAVLGSTWYLLGGHVHPHGNTDQIFSACIPSILAHVNESADRSLWTATGGLGYKIATPMSLQGSLYALGGIRLDDLNEVGGIHYYCPQTSCWQHVCELPTALYNCTCSVVSDDRLLLVGGYYHTVVKFFVSISKSTYIGKLQ